MEHPPTTVFSFELGYRLCGRRVVCRATAGGGGVAPVEVEQQAEQLTEDHYPRVARERQRIVAAGGRVACIEDVQLGELGELRVWKGESKRPGLPLSRSIGDALAKEVGVTAEPALRELAVAADDKMDIFDACGDAVIELSGSLVVQRLLDHHAYGCKAGELVGRSILSCIHPNHQKAFEHTAIALLAMPSPPRAVRMLHSVFYKRSGSRSEVIVIALRPMLPCLCTRLAP